MHDALVGGLYQLVGILVMLSPYVYRARKLRKLDPTRETGSLKLYHKISFLAREGMDILEVSVLPYVLNGNYGGEAVVFVSHLRASLYHIFCLFRNDPPVTSRVGDEKLYVYPDNERDWPLPHDPRKPRGNNLMIDARNLNLANLPIISPDGRIVALPQNVQQNFAANTRGRRTPNKRDTITSIQSDSSFVTNPYAGAGAAGAAGGGVGVGGAVNTPPLPGQAYSSVRPRYPPGFEPPNADNFILPRGDYLPITTFFFNYASITATRELPGSHPLRLSVELEYSAFQWDCLHMHKSARQRATQAIRVWNQDARGEALERSLQEDSTAHVAALLQMRKRQPWEGTPRVGDRGPLSGSPPRRAETSSRNNRASAPGGRSSPGRPQAGSPPRRSQRSRQEGSGSPPNSADHAKSVAGSSGSSRTAQPSHRRKIAGSGSGSGSSGMLTQTGRGGEQSERGGGNGSNTAVQRSPPEPRSPTETRRMATTRSPQEPRQVVVEQHASPTSRSRRAPREQSPQQPRTHTTVRQPQQSRTYATTTTPPNSPPQTRASRTGREHTSGQHVPPPPPLPEPPLQPPSDPRRSRAHNGNGSNRGARRR